MTPKDLPVVNLTLNATTATGLVTLHASVDHAVDQDLTPVSAEGAEDVILALNRHVTAVGTTAMTVDVHLIVEDAAPVVIVTRDAMIVTTAIDATTDVKTAMIVVTIEAVMTNGVMLASPRSAALSVVVALLVPLWMEISTIDAEVP